MRAGGPKLARRSSVLEQLRDRASRRTRRRACPRSAVLGAHAVSFVNAGESLKAVSASGVQHGRGVGLFYPATSLRRDQRKTMWVALVIRRHRTAPTVSAWTRKSRTRRRLAGDGAWAISSSHVSSTAALNLARSTGAARAR